MATNELSVKINSAEILGLQNDGKEIVINPNAEKAILRLLDIQREVDGAVEWVKSEIERQALEFNPNFTALKSGKLKINYSAAGAKYKATGDAARHSGKFWKKKVTWTLDLKAIDEFRAKRRALPKGILAVARQKHIQIKEVEE